MAKTKIEFKDNILQVIGQIEMNSKEALLEATMEWHRGVVKILSGPRSGKVYPVPGTKRMYTASAPGEAPAVRLGDLRTSYRFTVKNYEGLVGTPLKYALGLEKGTSYTAPRPHLLPAYIRNRKAIQAKFARRWV